MPRHGLWRGAQQQPPRVLPTILLLVNKLSFLNVAALFPFPHPGHPESHRQRATVYISHPRHHRTVTANNCHHHTVAVTVLLSPFTVVSNPVTLGLDGSPPSSLLESPASVTCIALASPLNSSKYPRSCSGLRAGIFRPTQYRGYRTASTHTDTAMMVTVTVASPCRYPYRYRDDGYSHSGIQWHPHPQLPAVVTQLHSDYINPSQPFVVSHSQPPTAALQSQPFNRP